METRKSVSGAARNPWSLPGLWGARALRECQGGGGKSHHSRLGSSPCEINEWERVSPALSPGAAGTPPSPLSLAGLQDHVGIQEVPGTGGECLHQASAGFQGGSG